MSDPISDVEKAEQLSRRRARMMMPFAVIFVTLQATFFSAGANDHRLVSWVHTLGWLLLAAVILAALATGGFWFRPKAVRALMEDEVTRENRHRALSLGFVMAMGAAMVLFVVDRIEPIGAQAAIHIILSAGLGTGLVVFAALERRALG